MTKKSDAPAIRFKGFSDAWEQRKLGELVDRVVRKNTNNESTLPLTISAQYGLVDQITYFNNRVASRDVSNYYLVLNGEFAYNKSTSDGYPFGAVKRLDLYEKGVLSTLYIVFAPKKEQQIDSDYLTVFFDTDRWHKGVAERAAEGARNHGLLNISAEDFFDIDLSVPKDIVEQKQIGAFIRQLDNLITLHQRKFEKLTNVKKSMLEKMFPQNGSSYPEIRFKGFTDPWEQRKLGDIADIVGGGTPSTGNQSYWDGDIDWYAPAEIADQIYANSSQKKITGLGYENSSAKMLPPGTVLFTSRAGIGKTAILTRKGCTNQGFQSIVPHRGELDSYFIFSRTEELKRYGELVGAGSTFVEVSGKQMAVMELMMPPTMREQQTIGGFFQQLDHLITLHQRECISFTARAGRRILTANKKRNTSSWEQRKLGEIGSVSMCRRIFKEQTSETGDIPFYKIGTFGADPDAFISRELFEEYKSKYPYPQKGDILISASGSIGRAVEFAGNNEYFQDSNIVWLNHDERLSNPFLKCFYSVVKWAGIEGSTIKRLYNDNILNTVICMPSVPEQKRIGLFFENLDNLITLHQRKPFLMKWRTSDANRNKTNRLVL